MKLIIDIPEERHDEIHSLKFVQYGLKSEENKKLFYLLINAVQDATPLEKHDEEIIKETVESIWGKPPYTELLDEIRNEFIDRYPRNYANELELGGRSCVFSLNEILQIIDKYRKGQTDADSD